MDVAEVPQLPSASGGTFSHPTMQESYLFLVKLRLEKLPNNTCVRSWQFHKHHTGPLRPVIGPKIHRERKKKAAKKPFRSPRCYCSLLPARQAAGIVTGGSRKDGEMDPQTGANQSLRDWRVQAARIKPFSDCPSQQTSSVSLCSGYFYLEQLSKANCWLA